ncbi:hypothetical protein COR50_16010 [Chitinophaga caeni]|uniref:Uncharacterized protein n=1 Tax=Chitinophaga caeni TaxID=2029983 RepID=A0A291QXF5_9BACT|nr:hypothetical protein [Chitinophaga caeni]ATL48544.1 hypothetical protein COR50_16010 [Chitinophaga caeni]
MKRPQLSWELMENEQCYTIAEIKRYYHYILMALVTSPEFESWAPNQRADAITLVQAGKQLMMDHCCIGE